MPPLSRGGPVGGGVKITIMTKFQIMSEGGKRLGHIKGLAAAYVQEGRTPIEIDAYVDRLIKEGGDKPNFKMEPGYHHATCINVNKGVVHGIPSNIPLQKADVVKVDLGLLHEGYHLDTSITVQVPPFTPKITQFLKVSQDAL